MADGNFLIESLEHNRGDGVIIWWGPHQRGYTTSLSRAGRYSEEEARAICKEANYNGELNEQAWREEEVFLEKAGYIVHDMVFRGEFGV